MPFRPHLPGRRQTGTKKKPNDRLRSVVEETAIPATVGLLKDNEAFTFPSGTTWALMILEVEDIGGLSKSHRNDESKGQLIELIRSDHLHVVATEEMLEAEVLGLIPDRLTMSRLDEFSMMTSTTYSWGVAWYSGDDLIIEQTDETVGFDAVRDISLGQTSLRDAVGEEIWSSYSGEIAGGQVSDEAAQDVGEDADQSDADETEASPVYNDDAPIFDQGVSESEEDGPVYSKDEGSFDEPGGTDEAEAIQDEAADHSTGVSLPTTGLGEAEAGHGYVDEGQDEGDLNADEASDEEVYELSGQSFEDGQYGPGPVVPVETFQDHRQVQDAIARRFLSGDLDLDVDLISFNATFGIGVPVVQIEVPTGSSEWLADQIAQLTRQANASLFQLHQSNQDRMRTTYVNLASQHAQNIEKSVSFDRTGSPYGKLKEQADSRRDEALGEKDRRIRQARTEVAEQYQRQADEAGEAAQRTARSAYLERHRSRMEREQADRAAEVEESIEVDHSADMDKINELRRRGAALKMEKGQTAIFETLAEKQQTDHASEQHLLNEWSDYISKFVDDYRKADLVRTETLAEHDRRDDAVAAAQRDHMSIVASMQAQHEQQLRQSQADAQATEDAIRAQLERVESDWQHEVDLKASKLVSAEKQIKELREKNANIEAETEARLNRQLEEVRNDRDSAQRGNAQISEMQRRSNSMLIVLIVVLGILAFLAGGIFFSTILGG